jgi:cytochrome c
MKRYWLLLPALFLAACASQPSPAYSGDPVEGQKVARDLCSSCHAIAASGDSPNPAAPPLRHVLASYDPARLAEDLNNAVQISHRQMPQFYFGEHHADDVVAYIKTIQTPPG